MHEPFSSLLGTRRRFPVVLVLVVSSLAVVSACTKTEPIKEVVATLPVRGDALPDLAPEDWPWWRGPDRNGISRSATVPLDFDPARHVRWVSDLPGRGHASPTVTGDLVVIATADEKAEKQLLIGIDRATGTRRWTTLVHEGGFMAMHPKNSQASATPAADGQRVIAAFINDGRLMVTAVDRQGDILWQTNAGSFRSEHGFGSSPVIYHNAVIVLGDNLQGCFIAALDRESGDLIWRTRRPTTGKHGSYATPVVAPVAGRDQLLVHGMSRTTSYDPATGRELWYCDGPAEVTACTIATDGDLVFSSGGYPEKELLAIRGDGQGDVTETHVVWRTGKGVAYVPSPLCHDGRLLVVSDSGVATYLATGDGTRLGQTRLPGKFSASPILVGDHFLVTNEAGLTYAVRASPELEIVARNDLGSGGMATPAVGGGQLFVRTGNRLYCFEHGASSGDDANTANKQE